MDRTCNESVVALSVSVGGGGEDSGKGDEDLGGGAVNAADAEVTAL